MKPGEYHGRSGVPPKARFRTGTGAVVAAAGLSSRMGAFKPLLPLGGSTVIRILVDNLRQTGVSPIALVTGHRSEHLQEHLSGLDIDFVFNPEYAASDMFHSLALGLKRLEKRVGRLFLLPGDVPLFSPRSLELMLEAMNRSGAPLLIPACNGKRGHPVLIASRVIPELLAYRGGRGLKGAMAGRGEEIEVLELGDPGLLLDADRPEDYRRLLQYASEGGIPGVTPR